MKALSLWQPWATLIAIGAKQYETRSWSTAYRGSLVIHAAKRPDEAKALEMAIYRLSGHWAQTPLEHYAIEALYAFHGEPVGAFIPKLPLGAALCVVDLVDVVRVERVVCTLSAQEMAFGNYSAGRFAWKLANVRRFDKPIPLAGRQGLFDCEVVK